MAISQGSQPSIMPSVGISLRWTIENLRVDFEATQTVSEADENGEVTTFTPSDALKVLRSLPYQIDQDRKASREIDFKKRLQGLSLST